MGQDIIVNLSLVVYIATLTVIINTLTFLHRPVLRRFFASSGKRINGEFTETKINYITKMN